MPEISFTRESGRDLYTSADEGTPAELRPRYLLRQADSKAPNTLSLGETWNGAAYEGFYLFLSAPLAAGSEQALARMVRNAPLPGGARRLLWITNPATLPASITAYAVVQAGALLQTSTFTLRNLSLEVQAGCTIAPAAAGDALEVKAAGAGKILFRAAAGGEPAVAPPALRLPLAGAGAGAPAFAAALGGAAVATLGGDVRYFHLAPGDEKKMVDRRYPLFVLAEGATAGFDAALDPLRPADPARTRFAFDAAARAADLDGCFTTPTGRRLRLRPREGAALALCSSPADGGREVGWYLAPSGDFELVDPAGAAVPTLMCGLVPTEYVAPAASALTFIPGMPAFAPGFPPGPERDTVLDPLDTRGGTATTAWLRPADAATPSGYFAQPPRAVYFGHPNAVAPRLVEVVPVRVGEFGSGTRSAAGAGSATPGFAGFAAARLRGGDFGFPAAPYAGVTASAGGAEALPAFERDVLSAARWRIAPFLDDGPRFGTGATPAARKAGEARRPLRLADAAGRGAVLSPQGFLAVLNEDGSWRELVLARGPGGKGRIAFVPAAGGKAIAAPLAFALVSADVFLVVSRAGSSTLGGFESSATLGGFTLDLAPADAGKPLESILLFKFRQGALRKLVDDVNAWTSPGHFNDKVGDTFPVQETIRQFLLAAEHSDDPNLREFHRRIAVDPAWRGVLALNARVSGLRPELDGLRGRMDRPLRGHHLGIEVNQVQADPAEIVTSSLFGLILYPPVAEPPRRTPRHRVPTLRLHPPPPASSASADLDEPGERPDQDFSVEELTVLFRNSEVAEFRCRVALELNRLFGREVERAGAGGNRVLLTGSFQSREGVGGFTLQAREAARFRLPAPDGTVRVLETVALTGAEFVTAASAPQPDGKVKVTARFALAGGLGFAAAALALDLFGYGGTDGNALLPFTGLSLDYDFLRAPDGTVSDAGPLRFNAGGVAFGTPPAGSLRPGSLVAGMPLQLRGFRWAAAGLSAPGVGAQAVQVPLLTAGAGDDGAPSPGGHLTPSPPYALEFRLPLGSLGSLSTVQVSLDAGLILGWGPSDTVPQDDAAAVWVRLPALTPGIAGYSLQGVLKTSFGEGNLFRFTRPEGRDVYSLLFNNVALKLFGFTLPPGVVLDFVLFADPGPAPGTSNLGWYLGYVPKDGEA